MYSVPVLIGQWSASDILKMCLFMALELLTYVAVTRVISQAGYSRKLRWIPLSAFLLTNICFIWSIVVVDAVVTNGWFASLQSVSLLENMWRFNLFLLFLNWLFFIAFAFSPWPVAKIRLPKPSSVIPSSPLPTQVVGRMPPQPMVPVSPVATPSDSSNDVDSITTAVIEQSLKELPEKPGSPYWS